MGDERHNGSRVEPGPTAIGTRRTISCPMAIRMLGWHVGDGHHSRGLSAGLHCCAGHSGAADRETAARRVPRPHPSSVRHRCRTGGSPFSPGAPAGASSHSHQAW